MFAYLSGRTACVAVLAVTVGLPSGWCRPHDVTPTFHESDYRFSTTERDAVQSIADAAAADVRRLLPTLPRKLVMQVHAGTRVVPESGETGYSAQPNIVYWTVDPNRHGGVLAITQRQLRSSLFEFLYRLVRHQTVAGTTVIDEVVTDGMAIAFARDFGGSEPPWSKYSDDVADTVDGLLSLPPQAQRSYVRSSTRRWIWLQVGTYLADQATRSSGLSLAQLVIRPTEDVLRMAHVTDAASDTLRTSPDRR